MIKWFGRQGLVGQAGAGARPWTLADLFANGESGLLLSYQPDHLYTDVDKTVPATIGGGVASFDDLSGNGVTGPQPTSTARPIFRESPARGEYDSADDVLPQDATLPAITDGTVILIGQQGIWIDEGYSFAGGNWSFGPTTYTGGPTGIIGVVGDMLDLVVLDRPLTANERDKVVAYGVKRGSAGETRAVRLEDGSGYLLTEDGNVIYTEAA